jgi:hypothetical protein
MWIQTDFTSRSSTPTRRRPIRRRSPASRLSVEALEDRTLLSTIVWTNEGNINNDTDLFNATYGANAVAARSIVDTAISRWETVIQNFNYNNVGQPGYASAANTYNLSIFAGNLGGGGRGVTTNIIVDPDGKPFNAIISLDDNGGGQGWYFDPAPADSGEFTTLLTRYAATFSGSGNDFERTITHEIGHAMGLLYGGTQAINQHFTFAGFDQSSASNGGGSQLYLFSAGSTTATFTTYNGGHIYEGPADPNFPNEPVSPNELMNDGRTIGAPPTERELPTPLDARILRDGYGYTIEPTSNMDSFLTTMQNGVLTVHNDPQAANETITLDTTTILGINLIVVTVDGITSSWFANSVTAIHVTPGTGTNTINIRRDYAGILVTVASQSSDTVNIGHDSTLQGIKGDIAISNSRFTTVNMDDSANGGGHTVTITSGEISGLAPANIFYNSVDVNALNITGSRGGSTYNVLGTPFFATTSLSSRGPDTVNVGNGGSLAGIAGDLVISNPPTFTTVNVYDWADAGSHTVTITDSAITGLAPGTAAIRYVKNDLAALTIKGSTGGSTYNIFSTPICTTTLINQGLDTVNVGNAGSLAGIGGTLKITDPLWYTAVTVDDSADASAHTGIIYNNGIPNGAYTVISGLTPAGSGDILLQGPDLRALTIRTGNGGNTFRIHDTPASLAPGGLTTTLTTGTGNDTVTIDGTNGPLDLNVQGGGNNVYVGTINANLDGIRGAINISGPPGVNGGFNYVRLDDRATTADRILTHTITATSYTRTAAAPISFRDVNSFALWTGSAADTINVQGRPPLPGDFSGFDIQAGPGNDIVNVGSAANGLADIGNVSVDGQDGGDSLNLYDQGATAPKAYSVGIDFNNNPLFVSNDTLLPYANVENLSLYGGSGGNTIRIAATSVSTATTLHTGTNNDVVTAGFTLARIQGPLSIDGQDGDDRLVLNDSSGASGQHYTFAPGSVTRSNGPPITYTAVEHLDHIGTNFDDAFQFAQVGLLPEGSPAEITINGNGGSDTLTGPDSDTTWELTGPGAGSLGDMSFSAISNLVGGAGVDSFLVGPTGSIGTVNGGGGGDWLDYSAFTTGVTVDLAAGAATGVAGGAAGGVSNIQNVAGSGGDDQLTGNDVGNILLGGGGSDALTGGNGRSLLIGGTGSAVITGGADDDIIIGGKTSFDQDHASLASILADWQRTDKTYAERINDLHSRDGDLGSSKLLYLVTVQAGGVDVLSGGPGQDWFFQFPSDTITDLNNGGTEQVENARLATGNLGYALQFGGTGGEDQGDGIATDAAGNVYTVGVFQGTMSLDAGRTTLTSQGYVDTYVAKYTSQGDLLWVQQWDGTDPTRDVTSGVYIKADAAGNVYVTGYFFGSTTIGSSSFSTTLSDPNQYAGFIAKMDSTGAVQWARQVAGASPGLADLYDFVVDGRGNIFVSGYYTRKVTLGAITLTSAGDSDGFVAKLDSAGTFLWARSLGGSGYDAAYGMSMDASGNLVTCGRFTGTAKFGGLSLTSVGNLDGFVAKFNGTGNFLWVRQLGGSLDDAAYSIRVDAAGNIYTSGGLGAPSLFGHYPTILLAKYTSAGTLVWSKQINDSAQNSFGETVAVDTAGNVYLNAVFSGTVTFGGTTLTSAGDYDIAVVKFTAAGAVTWVRQLGGTGSDTALGMAVDSSFNVYTTGWFQNNMDVDPGPDTCTLTSHNNPDTASTTDAFVWQLTQPGVMSYTAPVGSGPANLDLRLHGGYVQLVDATSNTVLLSKAQVDTTSVSIRAADGADTTLVIDFSGGSYAFPVTFTGGTGDNTLVGPSVPNQWTITGANAGKVGPVSFTKVANLVGGSDVDVFKFASAGSLSGRLDGGGAPAYKGDWLDYSGLSVAVTVNLQTGSATKIGGGADGRVSNIQNVHGGNGGNLLTGNAQGNILIGGTGNDTLVGGTGPSILIGGKGADNITGGSGNDILIGDYTAYDAMSTANENALMSILAEWQSADSYDTRFQDINTGIGGGLNGTAKLKYGTTVKNDSAADIITATDVVAGLDWFFGSVSDTINNFEAGEHKNNT